MKLPEYMITRYAELIMENEELLDVFEDFYNAGISMREKEKFDLGYDMGYQRGYNVGYERATEDEQYL